MFSILVLYSGGSLYWWIRVGFVFLKTSKVVEELHNFYTISRNNYVYYTCYATGMRMVVSRGQFWAHPIKKIWIKKIYF